jgi:hypothetical protein
MATLSFWQSDGTNATLKGQSQVPCHDRMQMRTVVHWVTAQLFIVKTLIDGQVYEAFADVAAGNPGIGLWDTPATNGMENVQIGKRSLLQPAQIDRTTLATSSFPDRVDLHWSDPAAHWTRKPGTTALSQWCH